MRSSGFAAMQLTDSTVNRIVHMFQVVGLGREEAGRLADHELSLLSDMARTNVTTVAKISDVTNLVTLDNGNQCLAGKIHYKIHYIMNETDIWPLWWAYKFIVIGRCILLHCDMTDGDIYIRSMDQNDPRANRAYFVPDSAAPLDTRMDCGNHICYAVRRVGKIHEELLLQHHENAVKINDLNPPLVFERELNGAYGLVAWSV